MFSVAEASLKRGRRDSWGDDAAAKSSTLGPLSDSDGTDMVRGLGSGSHSGTRR